MTRYCIRVKGHVSRRWFHALDDATITHEVGGITAITFPAVDQAALHGVLNRIRDLHVLLYSVVLLEDAAVETDGCSAAM